MNKVINDNTCHILWYNAGMYSCTYFQNSNIKFIDL